MFHPGKNGRASSVSSFQVAYLAAASDKSFREKSGVLFYALFAVASIAEPLQKLFLAFVPEILGSGAPELLA
jgi:hypothetical protein